MKTNFAQTASAITLTFGLLAGCSDKNQEVPPVKPIKETASAKDLSLTKEAFVEKWRKEIKNVLPQFSQSEINQISNYFQILLSDKIYEDMIHQISSRKEMVTDFARDRLLQQRIIVESTLRPIIELASAFTDIENRIQEFPKSIDDNDNFLGKRYFEEKMPLETLQSLPEPARSEGIAHFNKQRQFIDKIHKDGKISRKEAAEYSVVSPTFTDPALDDAAKYLLKNAGIPATEKTITGVKSQVEHLIWTEKNTGAIKQFHDSLKIMPI